VVIPAIEHDDVNVGPGQGLGRVQAAKATPDDDHPRARHCGYRTQTVPRPVSMNTTALTTHDSRQTMIARNVSS